jgi:hypothetical protein
VQHRRARDGDLGDLAGADDLGQTLEVFNVRMARREIDLADHAHFLGSRLNALELDATIAKIAFDARQVLEEIEMPPRPAIFAIGDTGQPDGLLFGDDLFDFGIFDRGQFRGADGFLFELLAGDLERGGSQDGANLVGAEWATLGGHDGPLVWRNIR